jgi:hypothetical protein
MRTRDFDIPARFAAEFLRAPLEACRLLSRVALAWVIALVRRAILSPLQATARLFQSSLRECDVLRQVR